MPDRRPPRTRPTTGPRSTAPRRDRSLGVVETLKRHPDDPLGLEAAFRRDLREQSTLPSHYWDDDGPGGMAWPRGVPAKEQWDMSTGEAEEAAGRKATRLQTRAQRLSRKALDLPGGASDAELNRKWRRDARSAASDPDRLLPVNRLSEGEYMSPINQPMRGNVLPGDVIDWRELGHEAAGRLESRVARQGKTIGSPEMFEQHDWFETLEPMERGEITRQAKLISRAGDLNDPIEYRKMRLLRDEMLSQDPRTLAEMQSRGARTRAMIEDRRAYRRADRASRLETRALASEVAGAQRFARGANRFLGRVALPIAVTGATLAALEARKEGQGYLGQAEAALKEGIGLDIRNANRMALQNLGNQLGFQPFPQDNTL